MMEIHCETSRYALFYDARCGIGFIRRKRDLAETTIITGSEMTHLRRMLNRAKTNATSKRKPYPPFTEIADVLLGEYFTR
jgi:hypothetical protein